MHMSGRVVEANGDTRIDHLFDIAASGDALLVVANHTHLDAAINEGDQQKRYKNNDSNSGRYDLWASITVFDISSSVMEKTQISMEALADRRYAVKLKEEYKNI